MAYLDDIIQSLRGQEVQEGCADPNGQPPAEEKVSPQRHKLHYSDEFYRLYGTKDNVGTR